VSYSNQSAISAYGGWQPLTHHWRKPDHPLQSASIL